MSEVIGNVQCACGSKAVPVKEGKGGALSSRCPDCGAQTMIKSPRGVSTWRALFGKQPAEKQTKAEPAGNDSDLLKI